MCEHSGKRTWRDETNGTTKPNTQHVTIFHPTNDPQWFVDTFKCMLGCVFKKIVNVLVIVWMGLASLPSFVHCTAHSIVSSLSRPLRLACCVCLVHSIILVTSFLWSSFSSLFYAWNSNLLFLYISSPTHVQPSTHWDLKWEWDGEVPRE